jgi:5-methylcytosine-specific restriction endonuclease McrA
MDTNMLALASSLSDRELLTRVSVLAARERGATAELVAHLAVLEARPSLYAAEGHGSLFSYCTQVLRLSEDATCSRIQVARISRRFPRILDLLSSGAMSLTSVRMLAPSLTPENQEAVLARASGRSCREIEALVAELTPRPDVAPSIRKVPAPATSAPRNEASLPTSPPVVSSTELTKPPSPAPAARRPIIETTAPDRYRVQFTLGKEGHDHLRRLQDLLRREIPSGDPGVIVERALALLLQNVEKAKFAATPRPRRTKPIRRATDKASTPGPSRDIPNDVQRRAWARDGGRCSYVGTNGQRCTERTFLEFHHVVPYALGGLATGENISLRCRRHNQYESDLVFGPRGVSEDREHGPWPRDWAGRSIPTSAGSS